MLALIRMAGLAAAAATVASFAPLGASAQTMTPQIAVPSPGGGGGSQGCYRVSHTIYGPYRMSFCLNRGRAGTYQVTGGGLNCNGGLDWYDQNNGRVEIDLHRSRCGSGTDWTGDSLSCRISGWRPFTQGGVGGAIGNAIVGAIQNQVAVPAPSYSSLNCTYRPAAGGYAPMSVTANRI